VRGFETDRRDGIARIRLNRGKVNAVNEPLVEEMSATVLEIAADSSARGVLLTGSGSFFSFGFDIPELLAYSRDDFVRFLTKFAEFYANLFLLPKPVVAALNGHAIAGGCMIALACDRRIMARGKAKISLNEITFGASIFAGSMEMLQYRVGPAMAEEIVFSGDMYEGEEALRRGLADRLEEPASLMEAAEEEVRLLAKRGGPAFAGVKTLARGPVGERMRSREKASIEEFAGIWYSKETQDQLRRIKIRD
jgi:enoyl-CoA hydratase/carnithine racemase